MRIVSLLLALSILCAAEEFPVIRYSKSFPGSVPAFVAISIDHAGNATYKEAPDDDNPAVFKLDPADTAEIFALADKLGHFTRPLESGLNVAKMGIKTFRWEDGKTSSEEKFNYSLDPDAKALADWFERIVETELNFFTLERSVKFDKLGVNSSLLQLQISMERKRLVCGAQFLPLLDRVAKNEAYMHMARERAAYLAETIRNGPKPKTE